MFYMCFFREGTGVVSMKGEDERVFSIIYDEDGLVIGLKRKTKRKGRDHEGRLRPLE